MKTFVIFSILQATMMVFPGIKANSADITDNPAKSIQSGVTVSQVSISNYREVDNITCKLMVVLTDESGNSVAPAQAYEKNISHYKFLEVPATTGTRKAHLEYLSEDTKEDILCPVYLLDNAMLTVSSDETDILAGTSGETNVDLSKLAPDVPLEATFGDPQEESISELDVSILSPSVPHEATFDESDFAQKISFSVTGFKVPREATFE
jgi:hypothetical protein